MKFAHKPSCAWSYAFLMLFFEITMKHLRRMMGSNLWDVQCCTVPYSTVQYSTVQYCTVLVFGFHGLVVLNS